MDFVLSRTKVDQIPGSNANWAFQGLLFKTMNPSPDPAWTLLTIAAVERETGIGKDTLRAWERRYGFPAPVRNERGDRAFTWSQVERLRRVNRLIAIGHRPGALMRMSTEELDALARTEAIGAWPGTGSATGRDAVDAAGPGSMLPLDDCIALLRDGGSPALRQWLMQALAGAGLAAFVAEGVGPLALAVGDAWVAGRIQVFEEHLVTEAMQAVLRHALLPLQASVSASRPRVLLTTVPGEEHVAGLLMAEAMLTLGGAACVSLGQATPVGEIAAAARAQAADVVALGFSERLAPARRVAALRELRAALDPGVELWVGGSGMASLRGAATAGWLALTLAEIDPAIAAWRGRRAPASGAPALVPEPSNSRP
jgi:hypothetical protein